MLIHSLTTTSERTVQDCLAKHRREERTAFVLSSRIKNDAAHIRYDVFLFVKNERL